MLPEAGIGVKGPDFLVIGHLTKDLGEEGYTLGGTAIYSALTARNLGREVAVVTSAGPDIEALEGVDLLCLPSPEVNLSTATTATTALSSGIAWGIGMFSVTYAFSRLAAPVAPMVPLYNTNPLVAVLLGMVLLRERPQRKLLLILGAVLIVIGASLVAI